jgi:hypothetical protein
MKNFDLTAIDNEKCNLGANYLSIKSDTTCEEWIKIGKGLAQVGRAVQFWVGDWACFGEKKGYYTDSKIYEQIEKITGYSHQTIKNVKYISSRVQSSRRRDDVSFSHYAEIASLEPHEQDYYIDMIVRNKLTRNELREAIHQNDLPEEKPRPSLRNIKIDTETQERINQAFEEENKPEPDMFSQSEKSRTLLDSIIQDQTDVLKAKEKLRLHVREDNIGQEAVFDIINGYLNSFDDTSRKIETAQNIIKYLRTVIINYQKIGA